MCNQNCGTRRTVLAAALTVGLSVTVGSGTAQADDRDPAATDSTVGQTIAKRRPQLRPQANRHGPDSGRKAASGAAPNPLEGFAAALAVINREINRLFFNRTPTAHPVQFAPRTPAIVTGTIGGSDPDDDPLTYAVVQSPTAGTVTVDSRGAYTYTADAGMAATGGVDTFMVAVRDTGFHFNFWTPTSLSVMVSVTIAAGTRPPAEPDMPPGAGEFTDLMTFGMFHGSSHTGMDALQGGRTAITTEALLAYNNLRRFTGLAPATLEDIGRWAFAHNLTNNAQAWDNDLQGVGLYYAMQGAKVGWIDDDRYTPQIVADIERTARLGSANDVMAMVAEYGRDGFEQYLMDNGYDTAFIDTLKMEPHYAGWMHDRANGRLVIDGTATAHDVNHLTVLSHDQSRPFMNDTWDWPQWPALYASGRRVIEYFQSMVALGDPLGENLL